MATGKQSSLLLYLIILMGLVLGYLFNSQTDPAADVPPVPNELQLTTLRSVDGVNIDYSALQNAQFQSLKTFGELPVRTQSDGTTNPFQ